MNENKRRSLILIIITIVTLVLVVGMATYAFFATTRNVGNAINANIGTAASMYSFSATSNGNIEMNIAFNEMSEAGVSTNVLKTDNATIDVSLASPTNDMKTTCTYDIVWVWDSNENNRYTTPDMTLPSTIDNKTYNYEFSSKVDDNDEKDLSKYPTSGNKVTLQKGASIESSSTTATEKQHKIDAYIYNIPVEQEKLFDKSFKAHITIDNLSCNMESGSASLAYHQTCNDESAACKIAKLYTVDGVNDLYYHDGEGNYTNADLEIGDNSYRYSGADPKNYVCFEEDANADGTCANDDLYRIIGVIDGKAKLIKYTNDGNMAWDIKADSSYNNTWEGSQIERYLNSNEASFTYYTTRYDPYIFEIEIKQTLTKEGYLNKLGTTKVNLIDDTIWSVGGFAYSNLSSQNAKEIYGLEINPTNKIPYTGKIGLMYLSEYMYAAEPTYWDKVGRNTSDEAANDVLNGRNDWMWSSGYPWTISRRSDFSDEYAFYVYSNGDAYVNLVGDVDFAVLPSFVLSSDATITNANAEDAGSKSAPYIITGKNASTGEKLAKYWNDNFVYVIYPHPNTPEAPYVYDSVAQLQSGYSDFANKPYYIKTTDTEHQACLYYNNKEFCLSKGYWVAEDSDGSRTKGKLKSAMEEALGVSSLSCGSYANDAGCNVGGFYCFAYSDGYVSCGGDGSSCDVDSDGDAFCA